MTKQHEPYQKKQTGIVSVKEEGMQILLHMGHCRVVNVSTNRMSSLKFTMGCFELYHFERLV